MVTPPAYQTPVPVSTPPKAPSGPLSFIRSLAILPVTLRIREAPVAFAGLTGKGAAADSRARRAKSLGDRAELRSLRLLAVEKLTGALTAGLTGVRGLDARPAAEMSSSDARLHITIDRVGEHTGASRELWLRAIVRLESADSNKSAGPFYGVGQAASPKWLIKPGYVWPDSDLMAEASRQATRQLIHSLRTGKEGLFVRAARVAVFPAVIPATAQKAIAAQKVNEGNGGETTLSAKDVQRQADVLFQPGLTRVVDTFTQDEIQGAFRRLGIRPLDMWQESGTLSAAPACLVGKALKADYVFLSRITEMNLDRRPASILQMGVMHRGEEIIAEVAVTGALIHCADSRILWQDRVVGTSGARTQFTKRGPRIRKEDQCLTDAARVAFALLRSSFENHKRQFEK